MSWEALKSSGLTLLKTPHWWRQQVWTLSTEITLSLLAAIGLVRGVAPAKVAIGLAIAYALASLAALPLARGGKGRLAWIGFLTIAFAIAAGSQEGKAGWWWLACACGGLMAFRDSAYITAVAWSPWKAMRRKTSAMSMTAAGQALGIVLAALATLVSAIMQNVWPSWAAVIVLMALVLGIPDAFMQRLRYKSERNPIVAFCQSWKLPKVRHHRARPLIMTAILFSSAHMMGRRLLLPLLIVALAKRAGATEHAVVMVGISMAFVSVLSLAMRFVLPGPQSTDPLQWFQKGLSINITAWMAIIVLGWLAPHLPMYIAIPWLVIAWLSMEIAGRRWSIGYVDSLRSLSHKVTSRKNRAHRELLVADVMSRNGVGATGMVIGGLAAPMLPAVMVVLLVICAYRLQNYDAAPIKKREEKAPAASSRKKVQEVATTLMDPIEQNSQLEIHKK